MKTQLIPRCLLRVILCILALGCCARASEIFFDDFSDGNIQDGSPVTWQWDPQGGQCAVSPQGLQLSPAQVYWSALQLLATDKHGARVQYRSNMTVKAQFNLGIEPTTIACIALVTPDYGPGSATGSYLLAFNRTWFFLARDDVYRADWHWSTQGRFDPAEDIIMQLDLIDITDGAGQRTASRLECRWWMAGQAMPVQPQIVGVDSVYDVSAVMLGAFTNSVEGSRANPVVFRWVEVIGSEIEVEPIVDFNGDGIVDSADMCMMIDYWGTDEPLYDIAPPPSGDGIVDVQDLILLSEHLFEEIYPTELIAYWKLDETEGTIAYDIAGGKDSFLFGDPLWQPDTGKKDGALQFDGIDDYVVSEPGINPADGPFSVFAWIKDGAPGQIILSQADGNGSGETWLGMDTVGGCLMTGLVPPPHGRFITQPLKSQSVINDGQWHHVGFVWDGFYRSLYVDGIEVSKDINTLAPLKSSNGSLYIGTSKTLDAGTFFSGLIDDVRIYNVALSAEKIAALAQ